MLSIKYLSNGDIFICVPTNAAINGSFKLHFFHKMERSEMAKMQHKNRLFDCFVRHFITLQALPKRQHFFEILTNTRHLRLTDFFLWIENPLIAIQYFVFQYVF